MSAYYKQKSVLTTVLGFCGTMIFAAILQAAPPQNQTAPSERGTLLKKDQDAVNSQLLAAAERFEALVEQAFSAKPAQLDSKISEAENAANQVSAMLPAGAQSELSKRLAEIRSARTANSRSELALASVEGYKILVSATHRTKVPIAVSLLDYSGFRYNADLNSKLTR